MSTNTTNNTTGDNSTSNNSTSNNTTSKPKPTETPEQKYQNAISKKIPEARKLFSGLFTKVVANQEITDPNFLSQYQLNEKQDILKGVENSLDVDLKAYQRNFNQTQNVHTDAIFTSDKQDYLIEKRNQKLKEQQDKLKEIEIQIQTKDKLTSINQDAAQQKDVTIKALTSLTVVLGFGVMFLVLYLTGAMTLRQAMISISLLFAVWFIYVIVIYNSDPSESNSKLQTVHKQKLPHKPSMDFCDCDGELIPRDIEEEESKSELDAVTSPTKPSTMPKVRTHTNKGFYYYDGTAPPQYQQATTQGHQQQSAQRPQIVWEVSESEKYAFRPVNQTQQFEPEARELKKDFALYDSVKTTINQYKQN